MKILQLGNYSPSAGGIASVLREYSSWNWPHSSHTFVDTYAQAPQFFGASRLAAAAWVLIRQRANFDVAHLHVSQKGSFAREGALLVLASKLKIPTVVTVHGSSFLEFLSAHRTGARWVLSHADVSIALYREAREALASLGVKVQTVPNGMSPPYTLSRHSHTGMQRVVFSGELSERKGIDTLMAAWPLVRESASDASLHLYGPSRVKVNELLGSSSGVHVYGPRPRKEVLAALAQADVFVLPSRAEAFPMSILEAMAVGLPVVSTCVAGIPGMLVDDRQLVAPGDSRALATTLSRLLCSPAVAQSLGASNRQRFHERFSDAAVMTELEKLYRVVSRS